MDAFCLRILSVASFLRLKRLVSSHSRGLREAATGSSGGDRCQTVDGPADWKACCSADWLSAGLRTVSYHHAAVNRCDWSPPVTIIVDVNLRYKWGTCCIRFTSSYNIHCPVYK